MSESIDLADPSARLATVTVSSFVSDTPLSKTSHMSESGVKKVEEHRPIVAAELEDHEFYAQHFDMKLFGDLFTEKRIKNYLKKSPMYDWPNQRWSIIPETPSLESELYEPFVNLIDDILDYFEYKTTRLVSRTSKTNIRHEPLSNVPASEDPQLKSSPDIIVTGHGKIEKEAGWNFNPVNEEPNPGPTYRNLKIVTPFEAKLDSAFTKKENFGQISVYARQCFIQQHNRKFVFSVLLSQKRARLYLFDRSGACYSEVIYINEEPVRFVRLILGVCSPSCADAGFDTDIYWSKDGVRFIETLDANQKKAVYRIKNGRPYYYRETIFGRGTICWAVDEGQLVKDQWASAERTPESDLLEKAKGLPFVGQMVAFVTGTSTAKLRGFDNYENEVSETDKKRFRNRLFRRVTLKNGGKPLEDFKTPEEVLYALRDVVQGHKNLWDKGILHRDISTNNILIAHSRTVQQRGTLIDLDMAILIDRTSSLARTDFRTGTRVFQSANVLSSAVNSDDRNELYPHDYLDDFESLFYVLCWMAWGYEGPEKRAARRPEYLGRWAIMDRDAADRKVAFFNKGKLPEVQAFFGTIFNDLIKDFFTFLRRKVLDKNAGTYPRFTTPESLHTTAQQHYDEVLAIFDKAIDAMEADEGFKARTQLPPPEECKTPEKNGATHRRRSGRIEARMKAVPYFRPERAEGQGGPSGKNAKAKKGKGKGSQA